MRTNRSSSSRKPRPCERCYRPLDDEHERFCASCTPKAKKLKLI
jgi:hypothetical protein